ncbi:MAG: hypothetical protein ACXW00_06460 [Methylobacter sp.]
MQPKPSKEQAIRYIQKNLPEYGEMLSRIEKKGGWLIFEPWLYKTLDTFKINDYAKLYPQENILNNLYINAVPDPEEFRKLTVELEQASDEQRTAFLDDFIVSIDQDDEDEAWTFKFPKTPGEEEQARKIWESLSETERTELGKRAACFYAFFMINFHNFFALMVHGRKITQLVAEALQGNDEAFVLAVQIDPSVMQFIPYFQERENQAYREGDRDFLNKLAYRRRIPPLQGKIRFRLLYLLFAMLESINLLDDLTHSEILDICDVAKLDRWQNRIEDVNYLTKRLREYRGFQRHKLIF